MSDSDCLFCKIVAGDIPCFKIYEDDQFLAFLDILPLTPGHTLVIPKQHFRWVWDVQPAGAYFEVITKIANHFRQILSDEFLPSVTLGEAVPHAHYHLLPSSQNLSKWLDQYSQFKRKEMLPATEAEAIVKKLALST